MSRTPASWLSSTLAGVLLALLSATPAAAHGEEGLADTDYRVTVTELSAWDGVEVRAVEAGARLELRNTGERVVEVLGYSREPYAEIRPSGVYLNTNSPAYWRNATADAEVAAPDTASSALPPRWTKVSDEPVLRWHDHRAGWMNARPPAAVLAEPDRAQPILDWQVPLRSGTDSGAVTGIVEWEPPPRTATWWAAVLLLAGAALAVTVRCRDPRPVAVPVGLLGVAAIVEAIGRASVTAEPENPWPVSLLANQSWQLLAGLGALAACGYALRRAAGAAEVALGIAAAALALLSGLSHVSCLSAAITPTPWSGDVSRTLAVAALGVGAGIAVGTLARLRRERAEASGVTAGP